MSLDNICHDSTNNTAKCADNLSFKVMFSDSTPIFQDFGTSVSFFPGSHWKLNEIEKFHHISVIRVEIHQNTKFRLILRIAPQNLWFMPTPKCTPF